jgi:hypothetical protein
MKLGFSLGDLYFEHIPFDNDKGVDKQEYKMLGTIMFNGVSGEYTLKEVKSLYHWLGRIIETYERE